MNTNDTTTTECPVYDIPATNLPRLQAKLDEMNRRAARLGCEPTVLKIVGEYDVERKREGTKIKYLAHYFQVEVTGQTPKLNGWQLMAAIEMQPSGENMVRCVPGQTVPESYRTTDTHCDHCKSTRFRKEVFILRHDDGHFAQVGRSCIADFLGNVSVEHILGRAEWDFALNTELKEAGEESYGGRGEIVVEISEFVSATAICVRRLGWMSKTKAAELDGGFGDGPIPTSSTAWRICTSNDKYTQELIVESQLYAEERDMELAAEAIAWGRSHGTTGVADYLYNLGVACRLDIVTYKTAGIVASVIAAYLREKERVAEMGLKAKKVSAHVGVVGERQGFAALTVKSLKYIESQFGVKTLCKFEDEAGNVLIWWCSGNSEWLKEGEVVDITGTVKKHNDFKGWLQTELSRVAEGLPKAKAPRKKKTVAAPVVETATLLNAHPCPL
jgi:hypothetical protein